MSLSLCTLIPERIKHSVKMAWRSYALKRCIAKLRPEREPSFEALSCSGRLYCTHRALRKLGLVSSGLWAPREPQEG